MSGISEIHNDDGIDKAHSTQEEKASAHTSYLSTAREAAEQGHLATDKYGNALVQFDPSAEARLRRKMDMYILPNITLLYLFCFIDRANIGNARIAGLERDLHMSGLDYNIVLTAFAISYVVAEIPSNMLCKRVGPGWYIPGLTVIFGAASFSTAYTRNRNQLFVVRFFLGAFEAGMMPGIAYYLSRWYRRSEFTFRMGCLIVTSPLAGGFGGLLASAILKIPSIAGLQQWRMIFFVEGIITMCLGTIAFFTMTDRPETAKWLSTEERALAAARLKSERIGTTEVLDKMDRAKFIKGLTSPVTLSTALMFLLITCPVNGLAFFLPTIIRGIYPGTTTVQQQLRTVPPYMVGAVFTLGPSYLSYKAGRRNIFMIGLAPLIAIGFLIFVCTANGTARYAGVFFATSGTFAFGALCNAQVSANIVSDTARASAIGLNVMGSSVGALIATWTYLPSDAPRYTTSSSINFAFGCLTFVTAIFTMLYMKYDNKRREKIDVDVRLANLSQKEIQDLDWKHPSFRWKP